MKISWNIRVTPSAVTMAATLLASSFVSLAPAQAADASTALPTQLSSTTGSTLIRSLVVNSDGFSFTMGTGLFQSSARFVVLIDGKYAGETYEGVSYYLGNSNASGVTSVGSQTPIAAGQRVEIALVDGKPGASYTRAPAGVVASAVSGELSDVSIDANSQLHLTMSDSAFKANTRTMIWVDGKYVSEVYAGVAYYASTSSANGLTNVWVPTTIKPGQKIEVGVVPGTPGSGTSSANARMIATVNATTAPKLLVDQASSTLLLGARGDAQADLVRENRQLRHNSTEPIGRFVKAGESIQVTLPPNSTSVEAVIGQYGPFAKLNGGRDVGVKRVKLTGGVNTVTSDRDGLVSLNKIEGAPEAVVVTGGMPVPTFVLGQTKASELKTQLNLFAESPLVVVEGERVVTVFQRSTVVNYLDSVTDDRVRSWDYVVKKSDEVAGLSIDNVGLHRKSAARIYITNPDSGGGYASVTYDWAKFQNDTGAGPDLLRAPITDQWGLWHEIGHTYETPQYLWGATGDVITNIPALAVQLSLGAPNRLDEPGNKSRTDAYLARPDAQRNFNVVVNGEPNHFARLGMFDGLRALFGDSFYPTLNKLYRERATSLNLTTDDAKQQYFMVTASDVSKKNLTAYFKKWGSWPNAATEAAMARFPLP